MLLVSTVFSAQFLADLGHVEPRIVELHGNALWTAMVMQKDLDSAQLSEQDLRLQLRRLTEKEKQKELAQEKALKWDLA